MSVVISGGNKLTNVRSFIILRSREGLISFNKSKRANVSGEKRKNGVRESLFFLCRGEGAATRRLLKKEIIW